jgi:predicted HTH domain antitoxin
MTMGIEIPDEIVSATGFSPDELRREIAVMLFQQDRLTLAQASRLAGISRIENQQLLSRRDIPLHYTEQDLDDDLETLRQQGLL